MKSIGTMVLAVLLLAACEDGRLHDEDMRVDGRFPGQLHKVKVEGCTYIIWNNKEGNSGMGGIAHAGNCANPEHKK